MAHLILSCVGLYLLIGALVALMLLPLLGRIDPAARGAYGFRVLLVPGTVMLWPLAIWCTLRAIKRLEPRSTP